MALPVLVQGIMLMVLLDDSVETPQKKACVAKQREQFGGIVRPAAETSFKSEAAAATTDQCDDVSSTNEY